MRLETNSREGGSMGINTTVERVGPFIFFFKRH
jgi:hypothetical protein